VVPLPHMPFWEMRRGPVGDGMVDVVVGAVLELVVDVVVVTGGGVLVVDVEEVLVEVLVGLVVVEVVDDEGKGSPSHQPYCGWHPTIWGQYWSPSPQ
jgi:hypothetical protein